MNGFESEFKMVFMLIPNSENGNQVNSAYFGAVEADRLAVKDGIAYFSGDGK